MSALAYLSRVAAGDLDGPDPPWRGVRLYVGGSAATMNRRPMLLTGPRMFNPVNPPRPAEWFTPALAAAVDGWLDSGAFQDVKPGRRVDPASALRRQLLWEERARERWGSPDWRLTRLVSYDLLIDEKWVGGRKVKQRWTEADAHRAVAETVAGAAYLAVRRSELAPRGLVMACQGVTARQYEGCVRGVLAHCRPGDVLGLGGWCILGRTKSLLSEFGRTVRRVLPLAAAAGLSHVHVFGVTWRPALGGLLWEADRHGLSVSTDSSSPVLAACWKTCRPSNKKCDTWEENCVWWREELANLRATPFYAPIADSPVVSICDTLGDEA